jgi:hypothetical protein
MKANRAHYEIPESSKNNEIKRLAWGAGPVLTPKDVGGRWKVSERTVTGLARRGILPGIRIGKLWRFPISAIEDFEQTQLVSDGEVNEIVGG